MKPFPVGQTILISDAVTLAPHVQESPTVLSPEHLVQAAQSAVIRTVYAATHAGTRYFFYTRGASPLLWPHAAIVVPMVGRRLTVTQAKPTEPRPPRIAT